MRWYIHVFEAAAPVWAEGRHLCRYRVTRSSWVLISLWHQREVRVMDFIDERVLPHMQKRTRRLHCWPVFGLVEVSGKWKPTATQQQQQQGGRTLVTAATAAVVARWSCCIMLIITFVAVVDDDDGGGGVGCGFVCFATMKHEIFLLLSILVVHTA